MKKPTNRKAVVISTVLTALILAVAGTAVFAWDRMSATSATQTVPTPVIQPVSRCQQRRRSATTTRRSPSSKPMPRSQPTRRSSNRLAQALNDAYAQINSLQAAQNQTAQGQFFGEHEGATTNGRVIILREDGG